VSQLLASRLPVTVSLSLGGAVLMLAGLSMPTFLVGLLLIYFLFFRLHLAGITWFPPGGCVPLAQDPVGWAQHLLLPWVTLAAVTAATYSRLTRSSMLEVLGEDYIRTARSKGLSGDRVVYRHGLRSALTPVVTLLGGVIVTERVFGLPGLGQLAWQSVTTQDLPVIIGTVLVASAFIVVANLLVDLGYALLDPRVRPS
jgi:peptide/nickel transport system permease protein